MVYDIRTKCYKKRVNGKEYEYCYAEILDTNRSDPRSRIVVRRLRLDREDDLRELWKIVIRNEIGKIRNTLNSLLKRLELLNTLLDNEENIAGFITSPSVALKLGSILPAGKNEVITHGQ